MQTWRIVAAAVVSVTLSLFRDLPSCHSPRQSHVVADRSSQTRHRAWKHRVLHKSLVLGLGLRLGLGPRLSLLSSCLQPSQACFRSQPPGLLPRRLQGLSPHTSISGSSTLIPGLVARPSELSALSALSALPHHLPAPVHVCTYYNVRSTYLPGGTRVLDSGGTSPDRDVGTLSAWALGACKWGASRPRAMNVLHWTRGGGEEKYGDMETWGRVRE